MCFPVDVVFSTQNKQNIMNHSYQNAFTIAKDLLNTQGMKAFYKGLATSVGRASLVSSSRYAILQIQNIDPCRFLAYELTMQFLHSMNKE